MQQPTLPGTQGDGAEVTEVGQEEAAGVDATHYRIDLGPEGVAALGALDPNQVAMFELEYPEAVRSLDVWVANDLIRRVEVRFDPEMNSTESVDLEYRDLGADLSIHPPS